MDDNNDLFANIDSTPKSAPAAAESRAAPQAPAATAPVPAAAPRPASPAADGGNYDASAIRVLEGLEPVRMRPGMYIGGTDEKALHHLFAEVIDNAMDEAVAGHANFIEVSLDAEGYLSVTDNGRGIPVENHPQMPGKSTLEVILTVLHAGGKFDGKAYETSGGLHGVGVSVVNALSDDLEVEVARNRKLYRQRFSRGVPQGPLEEIGDIQNRRGTKVRFHPDPEIFGPHARFDPARVFRMARSKAYLFGGVEIRWSCDPGLLQEGSETPDKAVFHFPGGLKDYLQATLGKEHTVTREIFAGKTEKSGGHGALEWAVTWYGGDSMIHSYCNTIPTADGGTHEAGLRIALTKGLKNYADLTQNKRAAIVTTDDVMISAAGMLSVFIREPEFVGQTKDKLATVEAQRIVENALRDPFDHYLADNPAEAAKLLDWVIERAEERLRRRKEKEVNRKTAVRKLRLPGKLADCSQNSAAGAELFIVEGDSAGGSAKQARNRANQAILPLRGKILNVASAGREKLGANQQLADLIQALGCGTRSKYREEDLRYERVIVMTDADVDGAHIASLLITFFYQEMPELIRGSHLYLAVPPLYRLSQGAKVAYARDDAHREQLMRTEFSGRGKVEIGRFKGLGEMLPAQLKETTMDPRKRTLLKVEIDDVDFEGTRDAVDNLMGTKADARFRFIQERAVFADNLDI
ncbi:DNA topoisomerase IV subunit B [Rhizobium sp. TRM96647]|uniref:DNA topoisomerase IV subunit B n=1 Tax=unclassified Rhizobium TaxID=2613769 RepID=UPI0021E90522|nr:MULTISPECIES: DNA topoisomerase IV subunit B [unclassified Rhizobium]MCV3737526.1 DNA topoisomerase IV subunit B [Rhizobium sp. TRM96647]MCV3756384.1 DNA topoisomerase IV subunit B [Rhizobium sp. TRM96650]